MIFLPLLICVLGLIFYCVSKNNEAKPIYLYMFAVGLLVTLLDTPQYVQFFTTHH